MTEIDLSRNTGLPSLGTHIFKVIKFSEEEGTNGPYWRFICAIQEAGEDRGKEVMLNLSHSPKARWKLNEFFDAVQAPTVGVGRGEMFLGAVFRANVVHDNSSGQLRAGLSNMIPYDGQMEFENMTVGPAQVGNIDLSGLNLGEDDSDAPF